MFRRYLTTVAHHIFVMMLLVSMLLISSQVKGQQTVQAQSDRNAVASNTSTEEAKQQATPGAIPLYSDFMGVRLGTSADEAREKLGRPKDKGERQDFFVFSDVKSAQVFYDAQGRVTAISVDYLGTTSEAPLPEAILGEAIKARPDGSLYQLKRYPDSGYWVAYSRTAGENPLTTVTIQKM